MPRLPMLPDDAGRFARLVAMKHNPLELWGRSAYRLPVVVRRFQRRTQLLINDPEAIRHVLVSHAGSFTHFDWMRRLTAPVFGAGLQLAEGAAWKQQRSTIAAALTPKALGDIGSHVDAAYRDMEAFCDRHDGLPTDVLPMVRSATLGIAMGELFSLPVASFEPEILELVDAFKNDCLSVHPTDLLLSDRWSVGGHRRRRFRRRWLALIDRLIAARRAALPTGRSHPDLFDRLQSAARSDFNEHSGASLLRDQFATMMFSSQETTTMALIWSLFTLAGSGTWQSELADEAAAAAGSQDADALLRGLPKLRAHVSETLRLFPSSFVFVRQAVAKEMVAGHRVLPGDVIHISPTILHRHESFWRDPDLFDPARFLPGAEARNRFAYIPFGFGPRVCVGAHFALSETILLLRRILLDFTVGLAENAPALLPEVGRTTRPDRPIHFVFRRRSVIRNGFPE
jgi:cytochrome P450